MVATQSQRESALRQISQILAQAILRLANRAERELADSTLDDSSKTVLSVHGLTARDGRERSTHEHEHR